MFSVAQYSLALLLIAAVASNGPTEATNLRQQRNLQEKGDYFTAMLTRVNKERAAKGKSALCMNKKLQAAAQRHSDDMAAKNYMAHDGADGSTMSQRITEASYDWDSVAENVAAGQSDVESVMDSWMASQGHYENIMGDYTMFGTAYAYNTDSEFKYYWTQDFATGGTEACDSDDTTTPQEETVAPSTEVTMGEGSTTQETVQQTSTPSPTTPAPTTPVPETETQATVVPSTETPEVPATKAPVVTPAATTPGPVATPAATTLAPVATPAATTPFPVATPAATTPAPVATPAATTTPPSIATQEDCKSNF